MKFLLTIFLFSILFIGCQENNRNYYSFQDNKWNSKDLIKFNIDVLDSTKKYSTNIALRHTTSYKFQNIIVFTHQFFNDKKIKTDTLNIFLAEEGGRWLGKGKGGIKELDYTYKNNTIYRKGKHSFEVELAMRKQDLMEIKELHNISEISLYLLEENEK